MKNSNIDIFDRKALQQHRDRAASNFREHDFLFRRINVQLSERLEIIKKQFNSALDLGCHTGQLGKVVSRRNKIQNIVYCDISCEMARSCPMPRLVADEEEMPFKDNSFDVVISSLSLHWVNNLPAALLEIARCLKPDGLFLAAMFGEKTLLELRRSLIASESANSKHVYSRVSPFTTMRDVGNLLLRANYALPVVDRDNINVAYPNARALMAELRGMGETNSMRERPRHFTKPSILNATQTHYQKEKGKLCNQILAEFEIIYLTAWKSHHKQPQPLSRGSGKVPLIEALGVKGTKLFKQ